MSQKGPLFAALIVAALACLYAVLQTAWYESFRERIFDAITTLRSDTIAYSEAVVLDIDRATLERLGPWPWSRERLARLVDAIANLRPKAIAIDMLIEGPDELSPAALARKLASTVDEPTVKRLAADLTDGDQQLASALRRVRAVLGLALDPERAQGSIGSAPALPRVLTRGSFEASQLWHALGVIGPIAQLSSSAAGLGVLALPGDADGTVRRVPLLTVSNQHIYPGLAVELVRAARDATMLIVSDEPRTLAVADLVIRFGDDGLLRLVPTTPEQWSRRTLSLSRLIDGDASLPPLTDRVVLLGSSAPEAGGLRSAGSGLLVPSVQLQADAVSQLVSNVVPLRPAMLPTLEAILAIGAGIAAVCAGLFLPPLRGTFAIVVLSVCWIAASLLCYLTGQVLMDPVIVPAATVVCFAGSALAAAAETKRRETAIRRRFEQHLAPEIVRRIVERPDLLRLEGELRQITVLFTDIEDFTAMTERADPVKLIAALDRYFEGVCEIVAAHGGLVDKIVGDAVHIIFNAPIDMVDHAQRALECALKIQKFADQFRKTSEATALGFGRTRAGIETGPAIVGDVGGGRKLDYTAHGNAVNAAARLEAANKVLGTSICIGSGTAALLEPSRLRPLGRIKLRGRSGPQAVFDLWPDTYTDSDRRDYTAAASLAEHDPELAAVQLEAVAARKADDPIALGFAKRLRQASRDTLT
jgi:adenylate cyclase